VSSTTQRVEMLPHLKVELALRELRDGHGRPLLLLHGLGERTPDRIPPYLQGWPGPVHGLDFTGHGLSTVPHGGGYTCEALMSDADTALEALGQVTIFGRGLGGYVGLLLAGSRPREVRGLVIADGPGLAGGGSGFTSPAILHVEPGTPGPPDPWALVELARDIRPADYALDFARQASQLSGLANPITVAAIGRPDWLRAVVDDPFVAVGTVADALEEYAAIA
jgi:pimeloyl-ACP methyl ester carboxylesterase